MKYLKTTAVLLGAALLTACADPSAESAQESAEQKMNYVKTSVLYDTLIDMYANPDNYLGKQYHMVGMLYPSTSDGESFYSIYAEPSGSDEGWSLTGTISAASWIMIRSRSRAHSIRKRRSMTAMRSNIWCCASV